MDCFGMILTRKNRRNTRYSRLECWVCTCLI